MRSNEKPSAKRKEVMKSDENRQVIALEPARYFIAIA